MSRRRREHSRGAAMVEAAIGTSVLSVLLLMGIELLRVGYVSAACQLAVNEGGKWAAFGGSSGSTRLSEAKAKVAQYASSYGVTVNVANIKICPGLIPDCDVESALLPGELITVRLTHRLQQMWWNLDLTFDAAVKIEPY